MNLSKDKHADPLAEDRIIAIMAKAPRAGSVKTRLAKDLPSLDVVDLYRCLLQDTIALSQSLDSVSVALVCPTPDVNDLLCVAGSQVSVIAQSGEGLAAGLTSVFAHFANGQRRRIVALNSDSPHLPPSVLANALDALSTSDLVVGPTHDGGYYLVGATASHPQLFAGTGMGTSTALKALLLRAATLGLSVQFTAPFYDIDIPDDLNRLAAELKLEPARAPRTAAWLFRWNRIRTDQQASAGIP